MAPERSEIIELPAVTVAGHEASGLDMVDHPMRVMTRRAAGLEDPAWDSTARRQVADFFDSLASEWHTRSSAERTAVVVDALEREEVSGQLALEVGSGIGSYSALLGRHFAQVVSCEIAGEMLVRAPAGASHRVLADAAALPMADRLADAVVLVNAFLFPAEVARVLADDGLVVWVNTSGEQTPIHLSPAEVAAALPGSWHGVAGRAGAGLWSVLRRRA